MKVVILAGGRGTRLAEETGLRPKPMVEIGGRPILWHIMKQFAHHGFREFVIALGYKGDHIKRYFVDQLNLGGALTIDYARGEVTRQRSELRDWTVHLADTGVDSNTGGRIRRLAGLLEEPFILTYGDGVSDVDVPALVRFHEKHQRIATVTAVRPPARYGGLFFDGPLVDRFTEKPQAGEGWINGGYMVMQPGIVEHIESDSTSLESDVLEQLAAKRELASYRHDGFWQCMDTVRDKQFLESMWQGDQAPWKVWP